MPRINFQKSNWSGEMSVVDVKNDNGKFTIDCLPGENFRLERIGIDTAAIRGDSWAPDYELGKVFQLSDKSFLAMGSGIERVHKSAFVAAAKLICNIV